MFSGIGITNTTVTLLHDAFTDKQVKTINRLFKELDHDSLRYDLIRKFEKYKSDPYTFAYCQKEHIPLSAIMLDNKIIGICMYHYEDKDKTCFISGLYIDHNYRTKGYATQAITLLKELFKEKYPEATQIGLYVISENKPAKTLYEKCDFKSVFNYMCCKLED